jgi:hypothetical protein
VKNYIAITVFLALFLIESFIGRVFTHSFEFTCEELAANQMGYWIDYMHQYCTKIAIFVLIMWAALPIIHIAKVKLDIIDWLFLATCWVSELITVIDWLHNGNTRVEKYDWAVFSLIFILLILAKIKLYGIRNKRTGIY